MTEWPTSTIQNWGETQAAIDPFTGIHLCRGQANRDWPIMPSFRRVVKCTDDATALGLEMASLLQFRSQAHLYLGESVMPPNRFKLQALDTYLEWLALMQHYGAPTRLLDWTYSPYVAIYFAVIDNGPTDGVIWHFDPGPANIAVYQHYGRDLNASFDYADLSTDEVRVTEGTPRLFTAQKKMRTAREIAQQGHFTFTNRLMADHQEAIASTCQPSQFARIVIPATLKPEFTARLAAMNVTASTLFPGVEGICLSIRDGLRLAGAQAAETT